MYTDIQLLRIVKGMPVEKRAKIYERAINIMENDHRPKIYAIATILGCYYDDVGFWYRKAKIRIF